MITTVIVPGTYGEASQFMRENNLPRHECYVVMGKHQLNWNVPGVNFDAINELHLVGTCAERNTAYPFFQKQEANRMKPSLGDCVICIKGGKVTEPTNTHKSLLEKVQERNEENAKIRTA